jgi:F-type H+-transporting ATPase subunit b
MSELFSQLGIDWKLLIAQGVNFLIVLLVLAFVLFKPLLKILNERKDKIALGVKGGEEAERRLKEIEALKGHKLAESAKEGVLIIERAEKRAQEREREILESAAVKAGALLRETDARAAHERMEERERLYKEARGLLKQALAKAVAEDPKETNEKLILDAEKILRKQLA